ncbi:hypothetical protein EVAR_89722_1 [Eumeta japonica]|uniref:Uncharacterized protein n=1 Tax=Eumeta variegata TaxID=151549 RepID=A0A4C1Y3E8_EUMVA|nr:hypothetical protein EVAR_89722_1 [Eumeta japonica]
MFPKTGGESRSGARREMFWQRWLRNTSLLQRRHKWTEGGHRSKSETRSSSPTRHTLHVAEEHRRTGLQGSTGRVQWWTFARPMDAETTNCAPGGPAYRSGVVARSDRGGLLTAELRPPCAAVAAGEGCAGVGPLIGRAVRRRAHLRKSRALSATAVCIRARPAVSPPSTADEETLSLLSSERVLVRPPPAVSLTVQK